MRGSKRPAAKANSSRCRITWSKLLKKSLVIDADMQKQLLALPGEQFANVVRKLLELGSAFGKPHEHTGLGLRKSRPDLFECRAGLSLRVRRSKSGRTRRQRVRRCGRWPRSRLHGARGAREPSREIPARHRCLAASDRLAPAWSCPLGNAAHIRPTLPPCPRRLLRGGELPSSRSGKPRKEIPRHPARHRSLATK